MALLCQRNGSAWRVRFEPTVSLHTRRFSIPVPRAARSTSTGCAQAREFDPDTRDRFLAGAMLT